MATFNVKTAVAINKTPNVLLSFISHEYQNTYQIIECTVMDMTLTPQNSFAFASVSDDYVSVYAPQTYHHNGKIRILLHSNINHERIVSVVVYQQ
jgi:hypothetical protein